jgi:general secretion pathway protein J
VTAHSRSRRGVTLIEVLIAVTLFSLLSVGMLMAMRIGLTAFGKTDDKLMANRRAVGAQRVVEDELQGMMPVLALCGGASGAPPVRMPFFQGEAGTIRLVSLFSLQQGWRGQPQILELFVVPGENQRGVRLVVNEIPYTGPLGAGQLCTGAVVAGLPQFVPVSPTPQSFVLADQLAYCRFSFFGFTEPGKPPVWVPDWRLRAWPVGIRVEMAPLEIDPSRIHPISITAPIHFYRSPEIAYVDY